VNFSAHGSLAYNVECLSLLAHFGCFRISARVLTAPYSFLHFDRARGTDPSIEAPKTEEEPTTTSTEPESQPAGKGIPRFPYEAILLGAVSVILVLWSIQKRR
jgi:hypothetical protein